MSRLKRSDIKEQNVYKIAGDSGWGPGVKGQIVRVTRIDYMKRIRVSDLQGNTVGYISGERLRRL